MTLVQLINLNLFIMLEKLEQYYSEKALEIHGGLMPKKQVVEDDIDEE
jgi:hypothetical protein